MKRVFLILVLFCACDIPIPDSGCAIVKKEGNVLHVENCDDSGAAGTGVAGSSGAGGEHVHAGAGASGSPVAGAGGSAPVAGAPAHMHGGLPVQEPLPAFRPGSNSYDVLNTGELPKNASDGVGAFRNVCHVTHYAFEDPIVYPGQPGKAHLHAFFGNDKVDAFSTYDSLRSNGGGSCRGGIANRSGYWFPALLDPSGKVVQPTEIHSYYKSEYYGLSPSQIQKWPDGLRMVAGNMAASPSAPQNNFLFGWKCVNGSQKSHTIPNCSSDPDGVENFVSFNQCWDGVNLDSPDHRSHTAMPTRGGCPSSHPVAMPGLSFHIRYKNPPAGSRLSSDVYDGPGGFSSHGDVWTAWDPALPPVWVEKCVRAAKDCGSHMLGEGRVLQ